MKELKISHLNTQIKNNQILNSFIFEGLKKGQSCTIGNTLRRILLSEIKSYAISGIKTNLIKNEFENLQEVKEDSLEIFLNLKQVIFKKISNNLKKFFINGQLILDKPGIITASNILINNTSLKILNPNQYIATIYKKQKKNLEFIIEYNNGYKLRSSKYISIKKYLPLNVDFSPINTVNFEIYDDFHKQNEFLIFKIVTNGSITPKYAFLESIWKMLNLLEKLLEKIFIDLPKN